MDPKSSLWQAYRFGRCCEDQLPHGLGWRSEYPAFCSHGARTDASSQEMFPGRGGHTAPHYTWDFTIAFTLTGWVFFFCTMNKEVRGRCGKETI